MERLIIEATDETPNVNLSEDDAYLSFSGKSLPEDVRSFYNPILEWIDNYIGQARKKTTVEFKMDYFNTASSKIILDILLKVVDLRETGQELAVKWMYKTNDLDMKEAGEEYSEIAEIEFEFIPY